MTDEKQSEQFSVIRSDSFQINLGLGYHPDLNLPLVMLNVGPVNTAMGTPEARTLAVRLIECALLAEQDATKRHQPVIQKATADAMAQVKRR